MRPALTGGAGGVLVAQQLRFVTGKALGQGFQGGERQVAPAVFDVTDPITQAPRPL